MGSAAPSAAIWLHHEGGQSERIIRTADCISEGIEHLAEMEPRFARAVEMTGTVPLRLRKDGFAALLDAIVSQQVSVASADAIWGRLKDAFSQMF